MGTTVSGPPNPITDPEGRDWTQVEFDAIVGGSGTTFNAASNSIYSNDQPGYAYLPNPPTGASGIIHNHPIRGGAEQQNIDKYPSDRAGGGTDWESLQVFADRSGNANPSLWILGPDGVTREFKLSERAYYQGLTASQQGSGVGLSGKERNQSCS